MPSERASYVEPASGLRVDIGDQAWEVFDTHRQRRLWHKERGGLLFARSLGQDGRLVISEASQPHPKDRAGRTWLQFDHARCLADIDDRFAQELHFVGYWHTHAEARPVMSGRDLEVFRANLRDGGIALDKLLSVIVGTASDASGLCVATIGASSLAPTLLAPMSA